MKLSRLFGALVSAVLVVVFYAMPTLAKDEWLQVRSKNFNLVGNASERDIQKVANRLEQFRETFRLLFKGANLNSGIPTNVVVFKSKSAYKPFLPRRADGKADANIAGYFQPGDDANYITLSTEGEDADTYGTIFHEYVHFIINTNYGKSEVPPWFNEGLAEYYQTFAIEGDQKVKLGLPQNGHLQLLQQNKLIPLETLFKISNSALHQNGDHSRSIFYAESWALIHYLLQSGKSEGLGKFLTLAVADAPAEKAFQEAFQTTYAQMEQELRKYVVRNSYQYSVVELKNKLTFDAEMQTAALAETDSNAYLGDLLYHTNRHDDAETYLQKAVALKPDSSRANTTLGMVKLRQRKYDDAKKYFEKAISEDQKNHSAFYNYAYLISRENQDEFGFVDAFPHDKSAKMRDLLKKAVALNPSFTQSYELLAFISLVNGEQFDEAVAYLQKALKYQPGNQHYALRVAEIYARQNKFAPARDIADKIAKTADEPELKAKADNLLSQIKQREEIETSNRAAREQYETERKAFEARVREAEKNGQRVMVRRLPVKTVSPAEAAKAAAEAENRLINEVIKKPQANENQVIGRIQSVVCKSKTVTYTIKTQTETFALTSADFANLQLTSYKAGVAGAQLGCAADLSAVNSVLTFKTANANAANAARGELVAVDFVPNDFRLLTAAELAQEPAEVRQTTELSAADQPETAFQTETSAAAAPPPAANSDFAAQRREAMMQGIKAAMRPIQPGEKREIGTIEKIECSNKGMFIFFKTAAQTFKFNAAAAPQIRGFTPEIQQIQFGCGLKQVDVPVVFTFKEAAGKNNTNGDIIALEFVPKSFALDK